MSQPTELSKTPCPSCDQLTLKIVIRLVTRDGRAPLSWEEKGYLVRRPFLVCTYCGAETEGSPT